MKISLSNTSIINKKLLIPITIIGLGVTSLNAKNVNVMSNNENSIETKQKSDSNLWRNIFIGSSIVTAASFALYKKKKANEYEQISNKTGIPVEYLKAHNLVESLDLYTGLSNLEEEKNNDNIIQQLKENFEIIAFYDENGWNVFEKEDKEKLNNLKSKILSKIYENKDIPIELKNEYDDIYNQKRLVPYM